MGPRPVKVFLKPDVVNSYQVKALNNPEPKNNSAALNRLCAVRILEQTCSHEDLVCSWVEWYEVGDVVDSVLEGDPDSVLW